MRGFFCALFAGILCLESIGGFCLQGYVSEGIREQATHLFMKQRKRKPGSCRRIYTCMHRRRCFWMPTPGGYYMEK